MAAHADAHDGDLCHVLVGHELVVVDFARSLDFFHRLPGACHLAYRQRKRHVGAAILGDVLDDHVHVHPGARQRAEDRGGNAWPVRDRKQRHFRLVAAEGDTGNHVLFHDVLLGTDERAGIVVIAPESRQDAQAHVVAHRKLDRAGLKHARAERGQFQHFLERDPVQLAGLRRDPGIGRVDPVDIRVDVAALGSECGCKRNRCRVRTAATECRDASF